MLRIELNKRFCLWFFIGGTQKTSKKIVALYHLRKIIILFWREVILHHHPLAL